MLVVTGPKRETQTLTKNSGKRATAFLSSLKEMEAKQ